MTDYTKLTKTQAPALMRLALCTTTKLSTVRPKACTSFNPQIFRKQTQSDLSAFRAGAFNCDCVRSAMDRPPGLNYDGCGFQWELPGHGSRRGAPTQIPSLVIDGTFFCDHGMRQRSQQRTLKRLFGKPLSGVS
jgi:hypothetical protein